MPARRRRDIPVVTDVAPGVRLHLLRSPRFTTTVCRAVLHRDLGPEATATSVLAGVLQSATSCHPTRQALAARLADLYGASLHVAVSRLGDRQILSATLEWPTAHVPGADRQLGEGLDLLREVIAEPRLRGRGPDALLDPDLVRTEQRNLVRTLRSLAEDRARFATSRAIRLACRDEPFGLEPLGREEDVPAATPALLTRLHRRLCRRAPVDLFLVGDLPRTTATAAVRRHLLWPARSARPERVRAAGSVRPARRTPLRRTEHERLQQAHLVWIGRARIPPRSGGALAAEAFAAVLGGGSFGRLFQVVREERALCYHAYADWNRAKGLLLAHVALDPADVPRASRLVRRLWRDVAAGRGVEEPLAAWKEAMASQLAALGEDRAALLAWVQRATTLGLDPSPARAVERVTALRSRDVVRAGRQIRPDASYVLTPGAARIGEEA